MQKKWYRSRNDKMIGGVAGGIAEYFDIDPVIVRIIFAFTVIIGGSGLLAYILLWIIIPEVPFTIENDSNSNPSSTSEQRTTSEDDEVDKEQVTKNRTRTTYIFGGMLVVLGVILLFNNLFSFVVFWPLIFIALGIALLLKTRNKKNITELK